MLSAFGCNMKILIVDDDQTLLRNLELILNSYGHEITTFPSPETAIADLSMLETIECDVIIVDYNLKVFTADYFLSRLQKAIPDNCKVVLISGHTDIIENMDIETLGADIFVPKPLDLNYLLKTIEYAGSDKT